MYPGVWSLLQILVQIRFSKLREWGAADVECSNEIASFLDTSYKASQVSPRVNQPEKPSILLLSTNVAMDAIAGEYPNRIQVVKTNPQRHPGVVDFQASGEDCGRQASMLYRDERNNTLNCINGYEESTSFEHHAQKFLRGDACSCS